MPDDRELTCSVPLQHGQGRAIQQVLPHGYAANIVWNFRNACRRRVGRADRPMRPIRILRSIDYVGEGRVAVWCDRCKLATEYEYAVVAEKVPA